MRNNAIPSPAGRKNYFGDVCRKNVNFPGASSAFNLLEQVAEIEESSIVLRV